MTTTAYPNVVIIAVDRLGVNQINCAKESHLQKSGIELLCQESVRFTHAFTTSPLSVPALASVLTGQYPLRHKVRTNGKDFLSSLVITPAEWAQRQGVATSFFSGGPPVWRKSNLGQGFEIFDDHLNPSMAHLFRPFSKTQTIFENWVKEVGHQSFLSVFYVPDLAFIKTPTQTELGEVRNLTFESQLEEFDSSLFRFFQMLKKQKLWDSTQIILVGLNGPGSEDRFELTNNNLFSDRTQVGLLVKPVQKNARDQGLQWSVDENVTIADIGATLQKLYSKAEIPVSDLDQDFPIQPLNISTSKGPPATGKTERPLLIETAWSAWQENSSIRYAIRWDPFLVLLNERPLVFNSLIDHMETSPGHSTDGSLGRVFMKSLSLAEKWKLPLWPEPTVEAKLRWSGLANKTVSLERLAHRLKDDSELTVLYSLELLAKQNWPVLQKWAQGKGLHDLELIANKNLNPSFKGSFIQGCLNKDPKNCEDPASLALLEWASADIKDDSTLRENTRKKFFRLYFQQKLDRTIEENNLNLQGIWDISSQLRQNVPVIEALFALPELQKYRQISLRALQQIKDE